MGTIIPTPIIKAWAEDTSNKDSPSQTAVGAGIEYASPLTSSEPNGALYKIYEAVKCLQRTGGLYNASIPYISGQSCSIVRKMGSIYGISQYICTSATDISNTPPLTGATVTTVNGVDVYSGGVVSTSWTDADGLEGYAPTALDIAYDGTAANVPAQAAINVGSRQYINVRGGTAVTSANPEGRRSWFMRAPSIGEVLSIMDGIYTPKWAFHLDSTIAYPIRRLGVYRFRGQVVEAFAMFLNGQGFTDNGTSNQSKFWRSFSSSYPQCIIDNAVMRDYVFFGTAGATITPANYLGRVPVSVGTAILSSGTSENRATVGGVQDDQVQNVDHNHGLRSADWADQHCRGLVSSYGIAGRDVTSNSYIYLNAVNQQYVSGAAFYTTPRQGLNTREATYSVPLPMVVSLLPYGQITL